MVTAMTLSTRSGSAIRLKKTVKSADEYLDYTHETKELRDYKSRLVSILLSEKRGHRTLPGFSIPAAKMVDFTIDERLVLPEGGINLRETVNCPLTHFNSRMRAVIDAILRFEDDATSRIYVSEQVTPLFKFLRSNFPFIVGSEFLGNSIPLGSEDKAGVRNEDSTRLTFENERFDAICSFEVLEHIPNYHQALEEAYRVLRKGGRFYFTAPFIPVRNEHLIRAQLKGSEIVHLMEPEYHGDPVTGRGILCFQHFGWEISRELTTIGFSDVKAFVFDELEFGYYTADPVLVFQATKPSR